MRNTFLKFVLIPLLILGFAGVSFSATAVNTGRITPSYQKATLGLITNSTLNTISGSPTVITGVNIVSGATANVVGLFDASPTESVGFEAAPASNTASAIVFEAGAAANTSAFFDLSQTPIRTVNGLEASGANSTGGSYIIYTQQYP